MPSLALSQDPHFTQVTLTVSPDYYQLVITSSTGAVQLWSIPSNSDAPELLWNREESLSTIAASEFVELPEQASVVSVKRQDEGFVPRLFRQLVEAQVTIIFLACAQFHLLTREMAEPPSVPL